MRKIIILCACYCQFLILHAQHPQGHLSDWLAIDTTISIQISDYELAQKYWVSTVYNDGLWFCPRKPFVSQGKGLQAIIRGVDLFNFRQDSVVLSYPPLGSLWRKEALACCVYGLSREADKLLLVCDNQLMLYEKQKDGYGFLHRWFCFGVCAGYLHQNKVYALVDDKEKYCYHWLVYASEHAQTAEKIRDLPQPVPFLLQFEPNRYLQIKEDALYYLPPGACVVKRFSLQGSLLDSVSLDVETWKPFPQELIRQTNALPYGVERINHALRNQYRQYSFAKTVDALSDSLLLLSVNLGDDSYHRQMAVMRLRRTKLGWQRDFCTQFISDTTRIYANGFFPAVFYASNENLLLYPYKDRLLQLLLTPVEETFEGKSVIDYKRYKNQRFKYQLPAVKLRVQSMNNPWQFCDYDNKLCALDDLGKDRVVLMVNRQPQCSGCQQHLLEYLSSVDTSGVALACLMGRVDSYLQRRQQLRQFEELGVRSLKPLYEVENEVYGLLMAQRSYPSVFLWKRGWGIVGAFDTSAVFTEDLDKYEFSETFLKAIKLFVEQP
ncbi:MAG: hypothetical protein J5644_04040 [Bacteroidales bacterium]|nr:hypothetical protein [Bacteroidales bacterium]